MKTDKRVYCVRCKEETYRDKDEHAFICTGCGDRTPRTRVDRKFVSIDECDENLFAERVIENSEETENRHDAVMRRMHKLTPMEKQVIELLGEGKSQNDVAEIMSISRDEVKTYLNRARIKLV